MVSTYDVSGVQTQLLGYGGFPGPAVSGKQPYLTAASVTVTGRVETLRFGNGVTSVFQYDEGPTRSGGYGSELLVGQTITLPGGGILSQGVHTWDALGHLNSTTDAAQGPYGATYTFDDLGRVKTASFTLGNQALTRSYDYDSLGNLTTKDGATQEYGRAMRSVWTPEIPMLKAP